MQEKYHRQAKDISSLEWGFDDNGIKSRSYENHILEENADTDNTVQKIKF